MTITKEIIPAQVEKLENTDEILIKVDEYKDLFLDAKNLLMNSKAEGKKLSKKKLEKLFESANSKKEEVLAMIRDCTYEEFRKVRENIEGKSRMPGIEKWIYMELRAGMLNLKNNES